MQDESPTFIEEVVVCQLRFTISKREEDDASYVAMEHAFRNRDAYLDKWTVSRRIHSSLTKELLKKNIIQYTKDSYKVAHNSIEWQQPEGGITAEETLMLNVCGFSPSYDIFI